MIYSKTRPVKYDLLLEQIVKQIANSSCCIRNYSSEVSNSQRHEAEYYLTVGE